MKRDVNDVLRSLIRDREEKAAGPDVDGHLTTLGVPLVRHRDRHWLVDLTKIRVFRNLHTFVGLLINEVVEQCGFGAADIMVRRRVDPNLTPELAALGLDWVMLYARLDTAEGLPFHHRQFGEAMQMIFRTLQTERWGGILFPLFFRPSGPAAEEDQPALLFPFHHQDQNGEKGHFFLLEHNRPGRFLRITVEDAESSRLQLRHIPHRVVDQKPLHSYLPDIHRIAEQIHQGLLRECMNERAEYTEIPAHQRGLFDHLQRSGLEHLQSLRFTWPTDDTQMLLIERSDSPSDSLAMLIKEIQLLEDPLVLGCLARGDLVEMISGPFRIFFDLSRYGASLNVSFDERRTVFSLEDYLAKMPVLTKALAGKGEALKGVRLFLIHHVTSEVIGLIGAFKKSGCSTLTTFFVKYGGIIPDAYLETLMSLPPEVFRFYSLQKVESRRHLSGTFSFSRLFSPLVGLQEVDKTLFNGGMGFLGAMRLAAGHLFLREVLIAREKGEQVLLVEDGGYLAPLINRYSLEGKTVREVCAEFLIAPPATEAERPFSEWLETVFPGSVEHTRNGYDYVREVQKVFGRLQFPAASIAVSQLKRGPEARECAVAILNAAENILHRLGSLLSRRNVLILGSSGAIGGFLKRELLNRLDSGRLFGVDIAAMAGDAGVREVRTLEELGDEGLAAVDLVIGVVGKSILDRGHLEQMILYGTHRTVYFVSGSTKTVEFADLEAYLQSLRDAAEPRIGGLAVKLDWDALRDLQTGILQGYRVRLAFPDDPSKDRTLYLLGELMPINFLYYGIPGEIVDEVMEQLYRVSCGVVRQDRSAEKLPCRLLAVDRDINAEAETISGPDGSSCP
jgi:hypothetical protein